MCVYTDDIIYRTRFVRADSHGTASFGFAQRKNVNSVYRVIVCVRVCYSWNYIVLFNTVRKHCCGIGITYTFAYCARRADAQHTHVMMYCKSCYTPIPISYNNHNNTSRSNVFVHNRSRESIDPIQGRRIFIIPTLPHTWLLATAALPCSVCVLVFLQARARASDYNMFSYAFFIVFWRHYLMNWFIVSSWTTIAVVREGGGGVCVHRSAHNTPHTRTYIYVCVRVLWRASRARGEEKNGLLIFVVPPPPVYTACAYLVLQPLPPPSPVCHPATPGPAFANTATAVVAATNPYTRAFLHFSTIADVVVAVAPPKLLGGNDSRLCGCPVSGRRRFMAYLNKRTCPARHGPGTADGNVWYRVQETDTLSRPSIVCQTVGSRLRSGEIENCILLNLCVAEVAVELQLSPTSAQGPPPGEITFWK